MIEKERFIAILNAACYIANKHLGTGTFFTHDSIGMFIDGLIKISVDELKYTWGRETAPGTIEPEAALYRKLVSWHNQICRQITDRNSNLVFQTFPLTPPDERFLEVFDNMLFTMALERQFVPVSVKLEELSKDEQDAVLELITKQTGRMIVDKDIMVMHCTVAGKKELAGCVICEERELSKTVFVIYSDPQYKNPVTTHHAVKLATAFLTNDCEV